MPYADQNNYNRYQSCDCENKDNCNCNDACGCCPIGTIEVKDDCGNHVACLLPADAAQYTIDTLNVPEGFIKVFTNEGVYIGLLTVAEYTAWLATTGSSVTPGFNVVLGSTNEFAQVFTNTVGATTSNQQVLFDRYGVNGDIIATLLIPSVAGVTLTGTSTKIDSSGNIITSANNVIMAGTSLFTFKINYNGDSNALQPYEGVISFSGGGVNQYVKVTITFN